MRSKNNFVTYSDLECLPINLKCILENTICKLLNNSSCIKSVTPVYTQETRPTTALPGQIIYVSDLDGGTLQFFRDSDTSWVSLTQPLV